MVDFCCLTGCVQSEHSYGERTGDGVTSLWIEIPPGPISQVVFSDQENLGACVGGDLVTTLQLVDTAGPLAVTLSDFGARQPNLNVLWIDLGILLMAAGSLLCYRRRAHES
jgi:hypothetical protein